MASKLYNDLVNLRKYLEGKKKNNETTIQHLQKKNEEIQIMLNSVINIVKNSGGIKVENHDDKEND